MQEREGLGKLKQGSKRSYLAFMGMKEKVPGDQEDLGQRDRMRKGPHRKPERAKNNRNEKLQIKPTADKLSRQ